MTSLLLPPEVTEVVVSFTATDGSSGSDEYRGTSEAHALCKSPERTTTLLLLASAILDTTLAVLWPLGTLAIYPQHDDSAPAVALEADQRSALVAPVPTIDSCCYSNSFATNFPAVGPAWSDQV